MRNKTPLITEMVIQYGEQLLPIMFLSVFPVDVENGHGLLKFHHGFCSNGLKFSKTGDMPIFTGTLPRLARCKLSF